MRRLKALLIAAGLVTAPAGAVAGPSPDRQNPDSHEQTFEWSSEKPRLGVMVMELTPELRTHFGAPDHSGVLVAHVEPGTPAAKAGVTVGDVLVDVRGHSIDDAGDVRAALASVGKGQPASLKLVRDKKPLTVQATLASDAATTTAAPNWWGLKWFRDLPGMRSLPDQTRT
jgi:membrane-associated protease RseP (regulator of RpoE activity)